MAPQKMRVVGVDVVVIDQEEVECHRFKYDFTMANARCDAPRCDDAHLKT